MGAWLFLCACSEVPAGGTPSATPPATAAQSTAPASAAPEAQAPSLVAAAPASSKVVLRLDLRALRGAPLHAPLRQSMEMVGGIGATLQSWSQSCGFDVLEALDEVVIAGHQASKAPLFVARVKAGGSDPLPCAIAVTGATGKMETSGAVRMLRGPETVVAVEGNVVAFGTEAAVDEGLAALRSGAAPSAPVARQIASMGRQAMAAASSDRDAGFESATLRIDADGAGVRSAIRVELLNPKGADDVANAMRAEVASTRASPILAGPGGSRMEPILSAIRVSATGTTVEALLDVQGGPAEQAAAASIFTSLAIGGTRKYLALSKATEARKKVDAIAALLQAYVKRDGKKRLPASAPLTPAVVPSGLKYRPAPKDWGHATWSAIGFAPMEDTVYSYAIETAKDGRSAEVVARGDLDGDGKQSRIGRAVRVGGDGAVAIDAEMTVTDALE
jgi:hypothetical protein